MLDHIYGSRLQRLASIGGRRGNFSKHALQSNINLKEVILGRLKAKLPLL